MINSIETRLQNAAIQQLCSYPYVIFVALKDIAPGRGDIGEFMALTITMTSSCTSLRCATISVGC
jgi:hypothetical protein